MLPRTLQVQKTSHIFPIHLTWDHSCYKGKTRSLRKGDSDSVTCSFGVEEMATRVQMVVEPQEKLLANPGVQPVLLQLGDLLERPVEQEWGRARLGVYFPVCWRLVMVACILESGAPGEWLREIQKQQGLAGGS